MNNSVKTANFVYNSEGGIAFALVEYQDGTKVKVTSKEEVTRIMEQLRSQNKQILMETQLG